MITAFTARARRVRRATYLSLLFVVGACGQKAAEAPAEETTAKAAGPETVTLDTAQIRLGDIAVGPVDTIGTNELAVTGTITFDEDRVSHVGTHAQGRITALRAQVGTRVGAGAQLALLESPEIGQIRAAEREAEELVKIAEENFAREQRLAAQGISSRKEMLDAEAELRRQQAALRSAETRLRVLGAGHGTDGQFAIVAPFAGVIVARDANLGDVAEPTDTLFTVADLSHVWIALDIFERDLARVRVGETVAVRAAAYPDRPIEGRIVHVGSIVDPARRTVRARVEIPNRDALLKPGMFASASIRVTGGGTAAIAVPQDAVQEVDGRKAVFVPGDAPWTFRVRPVEVGDFVDGNRVIIRAGLSAGDRVVRRGAFVLRSELARGEIGEHGH